MLFDEDFVLAELSRLERLRQALADSSALITLEHQGLLDAALASVKLRTIPEVMEEWRRGTPASPELPLLDPLPHADYSGLITDRKLVSQAREHRLTVLTEDRRILQETEELGTPNACCLFLALRLHAAGQLARSGLDQVREEMAVNYSYDGRRLGLFDQMVVLLDKRG